MAKRRSDGNGRPKKDPDAWMSGQKIQLYCDRPMYEAIAALADDECEGVLAMAVRKLVREAFQARGH